MWRQTRARARENAAPSIALAGLLGGALLRWGITQPLIANWVWLVALLLGGAPLVWQTLRGMACGQFAADVVAMLAIVTSAVTGEYFAGLVIVLMQSGGEALERYALRRASSSLERLLANAPHRANRQEGASLVEIAVTEVRVGDTLVLRPGDLVPVDGTLTTASAMIDEASITGEPLARHKRCGDRLLSGSVNVGDACAMRADAVSADSQYSRIVELVRRAQEEKPPLQRLADRYAVWFTPLTLVVAGAGWLLTGDSRTVLAVLVLATPCPLILAVPVAVISGINRAAQAGIIVKNGAAIEHLGRARAVVFDKTGTLTVGEPGVERVIALTAMAPAALLRAAGSVEQLSSHLLGRALAREARQRVGALPLPTNFREVPGRGVEGEFEGQHVLVGSGRFLGERLGADCFPPVAHDGDLVAYVAIDRWPAAVVLFNDRLRPGGADLARRLRALGVQRTVMVTGDTAANAHAIGRQAGLDQVEANLLPEDKVRVLRALTTRYAPTVMVGDGINDAPALATATVGVAMGAHGTAISAEAADVVLLVDDVTKVVEALTIGQRMVRVARQSVVIGLGLSLLGMVVASFGLIPPAVGALLQEAIDVAVILNALRARWATAAV